jgi:hypothetical protein
MRFAPALLDLQGVQMAQRQPPEPFDYLRGEVSASRIAVANLIRLSVMGSLLSALSALFLRGVGRRGRTIEDRP